MEKKKVAITLEYTIREPSDEDLCAGYPESIKVTIDGKRVAPMETGFGRGGTQHVWDICNAGSEAWGFALEYGEV